MRISNSTILGLVVAVIFLCTHYFNVLKPLRRLFARRPLHRVVSTRLNLNTAPFVSGEFFRSIADVVINDTKKLDAFNKNKNITIQPGDIVFLKTDYIATVKTLEERSRGPFILITHDSAKKAPSGMRHRLNHHNLAYWYAQNKDYQHKRMQSVPLGIANSRWAHGNQTKILEFRKKMKPFNKRTVNVLVNFSNKTNPERKKVYSHFCDEKSKISSTCKAIMKSQDEYYSILGNTKFVISPPGKGMDCHRTWESVTLGAIPVVLNNSISQVYEGERILVVNSFQEVTPELLKAAEKRLGGLALSADSSKIYRKYWLNYFQQRRDELMKQHFLTSSFRNNLYSIICSLFVLVWLL